MFSDISWASYIQIVAFVLTFYYAYTLYTYYRYDLQRFLKGRQNLRTNGSAVNSTNQGMDVYKNSPTDHSNFMPKENSDGGYPLLVNALADEIKAFLLEAGNNNVRRDQLLSSLQLLLSKYPSVKSSPYKDSIQKLIEQESEINCTVHLGERELEGLWV